MNKQKKEITFSVNPETEQLLSVVAKNLGRPVPEIVEEWVNEVLKNLAVQMTPEK